MGGMLFLSLLVIAYLFLISFLGYRGYRNTRTAADYLVAGGGAHPVVMALSYGAAFISTSAIVGFGGAAAMFGLGILWLVFLNVFVGVFIAFVFVGIPTRAMGHRLGAHTFPELLGRRFDSETVHQFAAWLILLFMPLYAGVVLMGASKFIEVRFGMHYETALFFFSIIVALYVILGGLKGVMYADAMQGGIMLFGITLLVFLAYQRLGGVVPAHARLTGLADEAVRIMGTEGHRGWTAMPAFGSRFWWVLVTSIMLGVGVGVLAQPQLAVRYMTVKSGQELNRAVLVGGVFILMVTGGIYVVGALSNVYFLNDPEIGQISLVAANKDIEQIIPLFITRYMPGWLGDVFFITLMSAAMSTACGLFHAMGTAAGRDVYDRISGNTDSGRTILVTRAGIFATFLASVSLAYVLPVHFRGTGTAIVARGTAIFFGLCAASFLPMFLGGLFTRRITRAGALAGGFAGFGASLFWLVFVHAKEAQALLLCQALLGRPHLFGEARTGFILWSEVDPLVVALPLAFLVTAGVSLATRPFDAAHLDRCFGASSGKDS